MYAVEGTKTMKVPGRAGGYRPPPPDLPLLVPPAHNSGDDSGDDNGDDSGDDSGDDNGDDSGDDSIYMFVYNIY